MKNQTSSKRCDSCHTNMSFGVLCHGRSEGHWCWQKLQGNGKLINFEKKIVRKVHHWRDHTHKNMLISTANNDDLCQQPTVYPQLNKQNL